MTNPIARLWHYLFAPTSCFAKGLTEELHRQMPKRDWGTYSLVIDGATVEVTVWLSGSVGCTINDAPHSLNTISDQAELKAAVKALEQLHDYKSRQAALVQKAPIVAALEAIGCPEAR